MPHETDNVRAVHNFLIGIRLDDRICALAVSIIESEPRALDAASHRHRRHHGAASAAGAAIGHLVGVTRRGREGWCALEFVSAVLQIFAHQGSQRRTVYATRLPKTKPAPGRLVA
jgi:hypothetical protein